MWVTDGPPHALVAGQTILAFEPGVAPFTRLVEYVGKAVGDPRRLVKRKVGEFVVLDDTGTRDWIVLRNAPASDRGREVTVANQPFAGDNTASLEAYYQQGKGKRGRSVRAVTLDGELRRRGLAQQEVLVLKVDVEGALTARQATARQATARQADARARPMRAKPPRAPGRRFCDVAQLAADVAAVTAS